MLGNTLYGLSVLLKNPEVGQSEGSYLLHHLPWLVGSLGVLLLDTIVSFRDGGRGGRWAGRKVGGACFWTPSIFQGQGRGEGGRQGSLLLHTAQHPPIQAPR